jgi:hypothetical protein
MRAAARMATANRKTSQFNIVYLEVRISNPSGFSDKLNSGFVDCFTTLLPLKYTLFQHFFD